MLSNNNVEVKLHCFCLSWSEITETKQKIQTVKKLIQQLPKPNHDTMKLLFSHLHRYTQKHLNYTWTWPTSHTHTRALMYERCVCTETCAAKTSDVSELK